MTLKARHDRRDRPTQAGIDDLDSCANGDGIEQAHDVAGAHTDAAITGGASDPAFWSKGLKVIEGMIDELEAMDRAA